MHNTRAEAGGYGAPLRLSVVIPAHNEAESIGETVTTLASTLTAERIPHEILVVDDASSDGTAAVVNEVSTRSIPRCSWARCGSPAEEFDRRPASRGRGRPSSGHDCFRGRLFHKPLTGSLTPF
jgi:glycosyltransferase involved in cell wall biosynthesis